MKKRILSLLLILCMAVTLLPTAVFAEDATGNDPCGRGQNWRNSVSDAGSGCYRSGKRRYHRAWRR